MITTKAERLKLLNQTFEKHNYLPLEVANSLIAETGLTRKWILAWFRQKRFHTKRKELKTESLEESLTTEPQPLSSTVPSKPVVAASSDTIMAMKIETQETMMQKLAQQDPADLTATTSAQQAPACIETESPAQQISIDSDLPLAIPDAVPNYDCDESRIAVPASFLPSLRSLFMDRVARAPLVHLARLENIPLQSSWHHPDCPLVITCSNDLTWYSFEPKHLPATLKPQEAPLRYLDMLGRYMNPPYPPIDKMTLINLVLDDTLDPFKKAMGLLLLSRLGMKC